MSKIAFYRIANRVLGDNPDSVDEHRYEDIEIIDGYLKHAKANKNKVLFTGLYNSNPDKNPDISKVILIPKRVIQQSNSNINNLSTDHILIGDTNFNDYYRFIKTEDKNLLANFDKSEDKICFKLKNVHQISQDEKNKYFGLLNEEGNNVIKSLQHIAPVAFRNIK